MMSSLSQKYTHCPRLIELNVACTDELDSAVQEMPQYWAGTFIPALFNQKIYTPQMPAENGEAVGADTIRKTGCFRQTQKNMCASPCSSSTWSWTRSISTLLDRIKSVF